MRKVALVFGLAVVAPSIVLAWLAFRSVRHQQLVLERQQTSLFEGVADSLARNIGTHLQNQQQAFTQLVDHLRRTNDLVDLANRFDEELRAHWELAEVGFAVNLDGTLYSPTLFGRPEAHQFRLENDRFLCNREAVQVYWAGQTEVSSTSPQISPDPKTSPAIAKVSTGKTEFQRLMGDARSGLLARFLQDDLKLMVWYRPALEGDLVFGAQLRLPQLATQWRTLVTASEPLAGDVTVALLDHQDRTVAGRRLPDQRPFVSHELAGPLAHWEVAVFLQDPARFNAPARQLQRTLNLLLLLLILAIVTGSFLIIRQMRHELTVARQKTDFVSNVSHELKTPLTSIRMFSELLAEGRVDDPAKRQQFLNIIATETTRLSRLINNVLDFARLERGEKRYQFVPLDLCELVRELGTTFRPQFEAKGMTFRVVSPAAPVMVCGDRDALMQVLVNLLSNAEKYAGAGREVEMRLQQLNTTVEVQVLDRGLGVPPGCETRIFEQFFRAHDSLASGIQGSGLGLTLARQIARAHGGDVVYQPRDVGGSCFSLRLPANPPNPAYSAPA